MLTVVLLLGNIGLFSSYQVRWSLVHHCASNPHSLGCTLDFLDFYLLSFLSVANIFLLLMSICWRRALAVALAFSLLGAVLNFTQLALLLHHSFDSPYLKEELTSARVAQIATYTFLSFAHAALFLLDRLSSFTEQRITVSPRKFPSRRSPPPHSTPQRHEPSSSGSENFVPSEGEGEDPVQDATTDEKFVTPARRFEEALSEGGLDSERRLVLSKQ